MGADQPRPELVEPPRFALAPDEPPRQRLQLPATWRPGPARRCRQARRRARGRSSWRGGFRSTFSMSNTAPGSGSTCDSTHRLAATTRSARLRTGGGAAAWESAISPEVFADVAGTASGEPADMLAPKCVRPCNSSSAMAAAIVRSAWHTVLLVGKHTRCTTRRALPNARRGHYHPYPPVPSGSVGAPVGGSMGIPIARCRPRARVGHVVVSAQPTFQQTPSPCARGACACTRYRNSDIRSPSPRAWERRLLGLHQYRPKHTVPVAPTSTCHRPHLPALSLRSSTPRSGDHARSRPRAPAPGSRPGGPALRRRCWPP